MGMVPNSHSKEGFGLKNKGSFIHWGFSNHDSCRVLWVRFAFYKEHRKGGSCGVLFYPCLVAKPYPYMNISPIYIYAHCSYAYPSIH